MLKKMFKKIITMLRDCPNSACSFGTVETSNGGTDECKICKGKGYVN